MDKVDRNVLCLLIVVIVLVTAAWIYVGNGLAELITTVLEHYGISL